MGEKVTNTLGLTPEERGVIANGCHGCWVLAQALTAERQRRRDAGRYLHEIAQETSNNVGNQIKLLAGELSK